MIFRTYLHNIVCARYVTPGAEKGRVAKFTFSIIVHEYRRGGAPVPSMGMPLPTVQRNHYKAMYGEIVAFYEIAVHFFVV